MSLRIPIRSTGGSWCLGILAVPLLLLAGCDQLPPNSFEDCILQNIEGATSDVAAAQVAAACRAKFPQRFNQASTSRPLTQSEQAAITGRADYSPPSTRFSGNLYNGNRDVSVNTVFVNLHTTTAGKEEVRTYAIRINIPPLSASGFTVEVISGDANTGFNWGVVGASGSTD